MAKKNTIVSSPNVKDLDQLYVLYKSQTGNEKVSSDDFIQLMSIDSVERTLFLEKHCNYEFKDMETSVVLIASLKV